VDVFTPQRVSLATAAYIYKELTYPFPNNTNRYLGPSRNPNPDPKLKSLARARSRKFVTGGGWGSYA